MKIHAVLACFMLFFGPKYVAQSILIDTILPNTSFLSTVDSIEHFTSSSRSTLPSLGLQGGVFMDPLSAYRPLGVLMHPHSFSEQPIRFTALPLLGFAYGFGTQGSQHLKFAYAQSFQHAWLLNIHYEGHGASAFLRNNAWKQRNYRFDIANIGNRYQTKLTVEGLTDQRQFSGGIQVDSLAASFPLALLPVRKDSCNSNWRMQRISWQQSMDLLDDSTRFLGLIHRSTLALQRRVYGEQDTLHGLYPNIYVDSSSTLDRYERVSTTHQLGLGFSGPKFSVTAALVGDYWRMRMAGAQHDTLELGVLSDFSVTLSSWLFSARLAQNIRGGFGAIQIGLNAKGPISSTHQVQISAFQGNIAPDVLQRFYYGNTLQYQMQNPGLQGLLQVKTEMDGSFAGLLYELRVSGLRTQDVYQFNGTSWLQNTTESSRSLAVFELCVKKSFRGLALSPMFRYLFMKNAVFPTLITGGSIGYDGFVSKTKNLYLFSKISYQYVNRYTPLAIDPQLLVMQLTPSGSSSFAYHNVSATLGFKVKTFRLFVSGANLGSFWMNRAQPLYTHFPIPSWQLQLGLIWEFWN